MCNESRSFVSHLEPFTKSYKKSLTMYVSLFFIVSVLSECALACEPIKCIVSGCTNYWNFDKNLIDQVQPSYNLFKRKSISWVVDRNRCPNSALYLNDSYLQFDSESVSWTDDFTIAVWVNVQSQVKCSKLLDCGKKGQNELVINLNWCSDGGQSLQIYNEQSESQLLCRRYIAHILRTTVHEC